jgi:hypothetical protein
LVTLPDVASWVVIVTILYVGHPYPDTVGADVTVCEIVYVEGTTLGGADVGGGVAQDGIGDSDGSTFSL